MDQPKYLSYDFRDAIEPLVITRGTSLNRKTNLRAAKGHLTREISEEFRLFHNLYHDRENDEYLKIDDEGNEELVATVEPHCVRIQAQGAIRQFLTVKEMHVYQFNSVITSSRNIHLKEIGTHDAEIKTGRETTVYGDICWQHSYWDYHSLGDGHQSFSVLEGKRLIEPLPKSQISLSEVARGATRKAP